MSIYRESRRGDAVRGKKTKDDDEENEDDDRSECDGEETWREWLRRGEGERS